MYLERLLEINVNGCASEKITLEFQSHLSLNFEGYWFSIHTTRDSMLSWQVVSLRWDFAFARGSEKPLLKGEGRSGPLV